MTLSVCLSFDFDATSVWIAGTDNPAAISRGEFGPVAIPRILALLERHGARATFFIPGHTALAYPFLVKEIVAAGHEVGHHGWVHENPAEQTADGERDVFRRGLDALERVAGVQPEGYRSPAANFSVNTLDVLHEFGMRYDSSCQGGDYWPYYLRLGDKASKTEPYVFGEAVDLVELPFTWSLDDFPHMEFEVGWSTEQAAPSQVFEIWHGEFEYAHAHAPGGFLGICMHPQVIGRGHRIAMLDRLMTAMTDRGGVTFEPLGDYARRWRDANPLAQWRESDAVHARAAREALG
jgi:peptidoglycan/xylan/chitin deacetylase (PgdA/CDA1 family)